MLNIILLGITSFLTDVSSEMVYPLLPVYLVTVLGAGPAVLGLIEGVAESLASITKVFSGYFSDKLKSRKPFTILGYFASALGKVFLFLSIGWGFVLVGRLLDRFGKGVRTAPRDALIADSTSKGKRGSAFGLHRAMDTCGAAVGVVLAYFLVSHYTGNFKRVFFYSLIPAFIGVLVLFLVKEKKEKRDEQLGRKKISFSWKGLDKRLRLFLIFSFIFTLGNSSNQFLLLKAKDMGSPVTSVIILYLVFNVIQAVVIYPASWLSDKIGKKKLLVAGYLFYGLVYLGFALNNSLGHLWILFALYGIYMGLTEGVEKALIADISPAGLRATTIGLHATIIGIGLLPASVLAGVLWKLFGAQAPFYFGSFMGILASCGFFFVLKGL
ncbi:MAG: MFS transporter [Candidatus Omnitrophota bacterium]|jgi:MFS family permease|nr:MAG: MFS transporter [Candidatus Omnitrophota bacterium]